jgi:ribosome-binding protein aMBF1 (putative translation factor)
MEWAVATGLVNGVEVDRLGPTIVTTREMLAILTVRLVEKFDLKTA